MMILEKKGKDSQTGNQLRDQGCENRYTLDHDWCKAAGFCFSSINMYPYKLQKILKYL